MNSGFAAGGTIHTPLVFLARGVGSELITTLIKDRETRQQPDTRQGSALLVVAAQVIRHEPVALMATGGGVASAIYRVQSAIYRVRRLADVPQQQKYRRFLLCQGPRVFLCEATRQQRVRGAADRHD